MLTPGSFRSVQAGASSAAEHFSWPSKSWGLGDSWSRPLTTGGDLAVFVRASGGLHVTAERHEQGYPFWHAVARLVVTTPWPSTSLHLLSAHLAPTSPTIRLMEAESLAPVAKDGFVIAGGSWNALAASDPEPALNDIDAEHGRHVLDRSAAMHSRRPDSLTLLRTCETYGPRSGMPAGFGIDVTGYTARFLLAPL